MPLLTPSPSNTGGANRIVWYILTVATIALLSLIGAWGASITTHVAKSDDRITTLEAQYARIEVKIDLLLAKQGITFPPGH